MHDENPLIDLSGHWVGNSWGTHPATLFAEIETQGNILRLSLRANQQNQVFQFKGEAARGTPLQFDVTEITPGIKAASLGTVRFEHVAPDRMEGSWESDTGGKGIISLVRRVQPIAAAAEPEQIVSFEFDLGPIRIGRQDVEKIANTIERALPNNRGVVISYKERAKSTIKFARDFLTSIDQCGVGESVNISAQSAVSNTTNVSVKLEKFDSKIVVQSSNEMEARSIYSLIKDEISGRSKWAIELYKRFGLLPNTFVFFVLLVLIPELSLPNRGILVLSAFVLLVAHFYFYQYTARTKIDLRKQKFSWWQKAFPFFSSTLSGILSGLVVLLIYDLIS